MLMYPGSPHNMKTDSFHTPSTSLELRVCLAVPDPDLIPGPRELRSSQQRQTASCYSNRIPMFYLSGGSGAARQCFNNCVRVSGMHFRLMESAEVCGKELQSLKQQIDECVLADPSSDILALKKTLELYNF